MGVPGIVKLGFRYLLFKRRSFIAFTLSLFLVMLFCGVLLNASRFIQDGIARAVHTYYPDIMLIGNFPGNITEVVKRVDGVDKVSCIYMVEAIAKARGEPRTVLLVYSESIYEKGLFAVAYTAKPEGLEVLATPWDARALGVRKGDELTICSGGVCVEARLAGYYEPFTSLTVGVVLLGSKKLLDTFNASCRVLALSVKEGFRVKDVLERVARVVVEAGGSIEARYTLDRSVEALSKTVAIQGMTVSFTATLGLAITLLVVVAVSLAIVGLEEELSTIGVLKATGLTSWQVFAIYSLGRIVTILLSAVAAIILSPVLGYHLALLILNGMGLSASLVKPLIEPRFYTGLAFQELLLFIPLPTLVSLTPGLLAKRIGVVEALNPYVSRGSYRLGRASKLLAWSPWFVLLARKPGKAVVYMIVLILVALPVATLSMLQAGYGARMHYASKLDFETIIYTNPVYYHVVAKALRGVQFLALNVTRTRVGGYAVLVNYVVNPKALNMVAPLLEGRYPSRLGEAVVTSTVAKLLGVRVGDYIEIDGVKYRVTGIVQYYVENGLDIFVYGVGGGRLLTCYVKGLKPGEVRNLLEKHHIPARVVDARRFKMSIISGTSIALGILTPPLILSTLVAMCGLILVMVTDLTVNRHYITVLKSIGVESKRIAVWITKALTLLALAAIPAAIIASQPLAELIASTLAPSLGYDPPRVSLEALVVTTVTLLASTPIVYMAAYTMARKVKAREVTLTAF